ncbi:HAD-IIA family hydrolase [Millisia brevis]|uniref:HAD-IIA family hydrolase n=1 Tax=Millisia brevis TaxID=264148 RepID=UPI000832E114|nr:HAD-IIA family hydrolase [Millisia brevis]
MSTGPATLGNTYDVLLYDLDGTLYRGADAVPGAVEAVAAQQARSIYVTNNASRRPGDVAEHLRELGYPAADDDVVTSSQAGARLLAEHLEPGAEVMVVGADALCEEVERVGLVPVRTSGPKTAAVVQGHSPDTAWPVLAEAAFAIRAGAFWVATNTDATLPLARGLAPGNGAMVSALITATDRRPEVAGKPYRALMQDAIDRSGGTHPLVVGDRLDTDIAGAVTVGLDSLLVFTGVSTAADLLAADSSMRPTYLANSLAALDESPDATRVGPQSGWSVARDGDAVILRRADGDPDAPVDAEEGIRALRAAAAFTLDQPAPGGAIAGDAAAASAIDTWYR